ncbi:MAG: 6-bladed beta-propeller [Tannerella sp.]|nr:6-bladed beta-propeller [Tannerella sp.]
MTNHAQVTEIKLSQDNKEMHSMFLSDLIQSIEYIPLETSDECLIGDIYELSSYISDNYILVYSSRSAQLLLFDRKGKFVAQIGHKGEMLSEYLEHSVRSAFIDEYNNQIVIHIQYPSRLNYYDLKGKFLRSEPVKPEAIIFDFTDEHVYVTYSNNEGKPPYMYELMDRQFNVLKQQVKSIPFTIKDKIGVQIIFPFARYMYDGHWHFRETTLNDTLYKVGDDFVFTPKYVINTGKYHASASKRANVEGTPEAFFRLIHSCIMVRYMFETRDYLSICYKYDNRPYYCYYDKSQKKVFHIPSDNGIINDYDGGIDFWPQWQDNKFLYAFYEAHHFEGEHSKLQSDANPDSLKGGSNAIETYKNLLEKINADSNPVLIVVTIK